MELLTFAVNEDGTYTVIESIEAEEGEKYEDSLAALCEQYGIPVDRFNGTLDQKDLYDSNEIIAFLEDHPEYERIEFKGELMTIDGVRAVNDEAWTAILSAINFD